MNHPQPQQIAEELRKKFEEFDSELKRVEEKLSTPPYTSAGAFSFAFSEQPLTTGTKREWIGIMKHGSRWKICYGFSFENPPTNWTPVDSIPMDVRLRVVEHLGELEIRLLEYNRLMKSIVEGAVQKLKSIQ